MAVDHRVPSLRVLLIDDNPVFLSVACKFLRRLDRVNVVGATESAQKGLEQALETIPDIILVDLNMPDQHGLELLPRLREHLPHAGLVVLTLHDSNRMKQASLAAGADDFVVKSNLMTDLEPAMQRVWEQKSRRNGKSQA